MRILQLNNYADPIGGAEVYALALTRELIQRGHEVAFFGTSPDREEDGATLRVVRRPRYDVRLLFRDPTLRAALTEVVDRFRPDVLHLHNVFSWGVDVFELLGHTGVPLVQTVHDFGLLCPNSWCVWADGTPCSGGAGAKCFLHGCDKNYPFDAEVALHTLLKQRTLAAIVDLAICPSRHLAALMRANGAQDVRHLNYFVDPIATEVERERATRELVYIGRLEPEKGVEHLLDAMKLILRTDPSVHLSIVGSGTMSGTLGARARELQLDGAVSFLEQIPRAELGRFYSTATACVLPSVWSENSPLVAYECLAAGLPMIASRIGGIPELVEEGQGGFTFAPRDPVDLAEKALKLLTLPASARARMSTAMRERAEGLRIAPHLDRIEEFYGEVHSRSRRSSLPTLPIDGDVLALLHELGSEKGRLGTLYNQHVAHIRRLEETLTRHEKAAPEALSRPENAVLQAAVADEGEDPMQILRRLARALHLPKVFKG